MSRFCLGLALLLAACASPRVGEVGPTACSNGDDEDHDDLYDCEDPDCQNLDLCRKYVASHDGGGGGGGSGGADAGTIKPPAVKDSGLVMVPDKDSGSGAGSDEDSGVEVPIIDAGMPCDPQCATTEACIDGACVPVSAQQPGLYSLQILSAEVPNASPIILQCHDISCPEYSPITSPPFGACSCPIDPYVRATLTHMGQEPVVIGMTSAKVDEDSPKFDDPAIDVQIMSGDVLRFEVYDKDEGARDDLIFSCPVNLNDLMSDPEIEITCEPAPNNFAFPALVKAKLTAKL